MSVEFIRFIKPGAASTVFVSNLAKDVTASTLHKYFRTFGPIYEIFIKETSDETQISEQQQQQSGTFKYAFITYYSQQSAKDALELHNHKVQGRSIKVALKRRINSDYEGVFPLGLTKSIELANSYFPFSWSSTICSIKPFVESAEPPEDVAVAVRSEIPPNFNSPQQDEVAVAWICRVRHTYCGQSVHGIGIGYAVGPKENATPLAIKRATNNARKHAFARTTIINYGGKTGVVFIEPTWKLN